MNNRRANVPIDDLQPYPGNARRGDIEVIRESLRVHGQFRDIVVQESTGYILAGNHTWMAAKAEGFSEIGVTFVDCDEQQAKKIVLVDNRANDVAGYDVPSLAELLRDLDTLEGTGFDNQALDDLMNSLGAVGFKAGKDPDDAPEAPVDPKTKPGDLYQLGRHRLLCGDATSPTDLERLCEDVGVDLVFTDPPYNMNFDGRSGKWLAKDNKRPQKVLINDNLSTEGFDDLIRGSLANALSVLAPGGSAYVFCDWRHYPQVQSIYSEFFNQKSAIVWDKTHFGMGVHYRMQYELLIFGVNGEKPGIWTAGKTERDVWSIQRENVREYRHVTQKPVEIAERAIKNSSTKESVVLDLFCGSGTTLVACEGLGRSCLAMELDPAYCDVIVARWENLTENKATLL